MKRAVETAKKLKSENPDKNVFVLGELIHNSDVINELESLGIKTLTEIPEKGDGICVIRSHGESPEVIDKIIPVRNEDAIETARNLSQKEGILAGFSGGANIWAAIELSKKEENKDKLIAAILPDCGERYLSSELYSI